MSPELRSPTRSRPDGRTLFPFGIRTLFAGLLGAILCGSVGRADPAEVNPAAEVSALKAQVSALRSALAERNAAAGRLEASNAALKMNYCEAYYTSSHQVRTYCLCT